FPCPLLAARYALPGRLQPLLAGLIDLDLVRYLGVDVRIVRRLADVIVMPPRATPLAVARVVVAESLAMRVARMRAGKPFGHGSVLRSEECNRRADQRCASSYRYSTNDITAPSKPCTFGLADSMT